MLNISIIRSFTSSIRWAKIDHVYSFEFTFKIRYMTVSKLYLSVFVQFISRRRKRSAKKFFNTVLKNSTFSAKRTLFVPPRSHVSVVDVKLFWLTTWAISALSFRRDRRNNIYSDENFFEECERTLMHM